MVDEMLILALDASGGKAEANYMSRAEVFCFLPRDYTKATLPCLSQKQEK